ncbi:mechanosensitive ion channel domain-containing protein [Novosphingobium album (ex Hu et al. 2023)]|uniref:Small-conductance mechanosensitive channel n=1 Tax=Novosphingobium album (ex Hu et al. 2023) TaxID=2930093 RepID=A0ABT0AWM9_9SPHN|nr:mechanosensitive ion channel domain-containing protein [Novosphingobium album (ex Hu et al. 2023)]MCJ2177076.1 mechanosensitive ion channel [Novosphingobium album (ex Hu et al. 2023)]
MDKQAGLIVRTGALLLFVWLACSPALPAATAALPEVSPQPQAETSPAPGQTIGDTSEAGSDERIARRIEGIFAAVPALRNVTVSVRQGVVALDGTVATPDDIGRAEQIASRIVGVVTVENGIERKVSVEDSVQSLGGFSDKLANFVKMLPLIGAALAVALLIALVGYALAASTWLWRRLAPNSFLTELIASAIRFVFVMGGLVIALQMVGAGGLLGAVLGGAGIVGIALGFAMRDTIENYVASIMLSVRQPFRANDWIVIDQYEGRVIRLTSRATILMTLDGNHLRIPNSTVFKAVILNYTRNPQRRFDFELGINADADPTVARHLGVDALEQLGFVLKDPPPSARIEQVGDSNIVIKFLGWIDQTDTDWYKARSRAIPAVKSALESAGFALPEPIYRLRFDQNAPLPLRNVTGETPLAEPKATFAAEEEDEGTQEHVAPDEVIAEMVEKERRQAPEADKDLLDPRRPVE